MLILIRLFIDICLLRSNPQDFPPSRILEALCIFTYACIAVAMAITLEMTTGRALLLALVDTAILVGLGFAVLWIADLPARRCQTIIALTGSGTVFSLAAWPLYILQSQLPADAGLSGDLVNLALIVLGVWSLVVIAHILRHALSASLAVAAGIAMLYAILSIKVTLFIAKGPLLITTN